MKPVATEEARAGARVLSLFANPLHAEILRVHESGPLRLAELNEEISHAPHTTLRAALTTLRDLGALTTVPVGDSPKAVANQLTPVGEDLLFVAAVLGGWLAGASDGPIEPGSDEARSAIKSLAGGWSSALMRALAGHPFSLTELDSLIPEVSYPSLERRLSRMKMSHQIEPMQGGGRGTPYVVTDWLRRSVAPLCAAGRCERRHLRATAPPITAVEVEAAFLLSIPLVKLSPTANGICMLAVGIDGPRDRDGKPPFAGVTVEVERGQVVSCAARVTRWPSTWALGTAEAWLDVVIDGGLKGVRCKGYAPKLASDLVVGIHTALFE